MPVSSSPFRRLLVPSLLLSVLSLAACGGGGGSDDTPDLISATRVIGQADYVSGSANRGGAVSALGIAQPLGPIATDGSRFFIADYGNHRVLGYAEIPTATTPALFVLGQDSATDSTPGTGPTRMALPASVAIADGRLIVADAGNNRVLIWNSLPVGNTPPDVVVGQVDLLTDDPGTAADKLSFPVAATIANNRLIVSDQNNNRVLIWNTVPTANGTPADVVLGQQTFTTSVADDEEDGLNSPAGIWSDGFRLLVADSGNNRVLEFDAFPIANNALAVDVYGQDRDNFSARLPNDDDQDGVTDDTPSARTLSSATGVSVFANVLYVVDRNNHRVLAFPG